MAQPRPPAARRAIGATLLAVVGLSALLAAPAVARAPDPEPSASVPAPLPAGVEVDAADVAVGPEYWQGSTAQYRLTVKVTNTGEPAITSTTVVALPATVRHSSATADGCAVLSLTFECPLTRGAVATITVNSTVAADAWREPATGLVRTTGEAVDSGSTDTDEDTFAVVFPPGPPTPGIDLAVNDLSLPPQPPGRMGTTNLEVRLQNSGAVPAAGQVELLTPAGVTVATVPGGCVARKRISASREWCDVGPVGAGAELVLNFGLSIRPEVWAELPVAGSVQGSLTPSGQDAVMVQAAYLIIVATGPSPEAGAGDEPPGSYRIGDPLRGSVGPFGQPARRTSLTVNPQLSVAPMVTALFGLFTVVATMVILSLRRRASDDPAQSVTGERAGM